MKLSDRDKNMFMIKGELPPGPLGTEVQIAPWFNSMRTGDVNLGERQVWAFRERIENLRFQAYQANQEDQANQVNQANQANQVNQVNQVSQVKPVNPVNREDSEPPSPRA